MKIQNNVTSEKLATGCDGMAGKLADTALAIPARMLPYVETEELGKRVTTLEKRVTALEKEIVLLIWAIAAAAAAVAAVLLVCM